MAATNVQAFSGDVEITSNLAVNTNDLFVDTESGRVGIGVTGPAKKLHLLGVGTDSGPKIRFETLNNGNDQYTVDGKEIGGIQFGADDYSWLTQNMSSEIVGIHRNPNYSGAQGDLIFKTSGTQGSDPTEKMCIRYDGNVGIGSADPAEKLDVQGSAVITGLTYGIKSTGTLGSDKTEGWHRLLIGGIRDGASGIRTKCKLLVKASGLHQILTFDFNHMISLSDTTGNSFNLLGNDHYTSRVGVTKLRLADAGSNQIALDMYIDHDIIPVDRTWTINLYTEGGSLISEASTFLEKITGTPSASIEISTDTTIFGIVGSTTSRTLVMDENGNVGIGNAAPAFPLTIGSNDGNKILFNESTTPGHNITTSSGWQWNFNAGRSGEDDDTKITFNISGSSGYDEMMRVNHTGVGIGTASPKQKFEVHSSGYGLVGGRLGVGNVLTSAQSGNQDHWNLGTSAPLVVRSPQGSNPTVSYANARTYATIAFVPQFDASDTTNMGLWGSTSGENPVFYIQGQVNNGANGGGRIALQPVAGNVGIGVTNPGQRLHVAGGNIRVDGTGERIIENKNDSSDFGTLTLTSGYRGGSTRPKIQIHGYKGQASVHYDNVIEFHTAGQSRMKINQSGNVSIGNGTPICPLYVTSGVAGTFYPQWMRWLTNANINSTYDFHSYPYSALPGNAPVGIYSQYSVGTQSYIFSQGGGLTGSDRRIKKNIIDVDDESALETLRLLKPKKYSYKDTFNRGSNPVWGFIAQEVLETLPYSVSLQNDLIPNIYETANVSYSNVITFNNFNTSNLESNVTTITIMDLGGARHEAEIARIIDDRTIQVIENLDEFTMRYDGTGNVVTETTTTNLTEEEYEELSEDEKSDYSQTDSGYSKTVTTYPGTELFVFGQKVDDFHYLKKDAIWTIATAALQEVDRQQQNDQERITTLETQIASLTTRLDALEST